MYIELCCFVNILRTMDYFLTVIDADIALRKWKNRKMLDRTLLNWGDVVIPEGPGSSIGAFHFADAISCLWVVIIGELVKICDFWDVRPRVLFRTVPIGMGRIFVINPCRKHSLVVLPSHYLAHPDLYKYFDNFLCFRFEFFALFNLHLHFHRLIDCMCATVIRGQRSKFEVIWIFLEKGKFYK